MKTQNHRSSLTAQDIAARAHRIWEEEGYPYGRELAHWLKAEKELQVQCDQATAPTLATFPPEASSTPRLAHPPNLRVGLD